MELSDGGHDADRPQQRLADASAGRGAVECRSSVLPISTAARTSVQIRTGRSIWATGAPGHAAEAADPAGPGRCGGSGPRRPRPSAPPRPAVRRTSPADRRPPEEFPGPLPAKRGASLTPPLPRGEKSFSCAPLSSAERGIGARGPATGEPSPWASWCAEGRRQGPAVQLTAGLDGHPAICRRSAPPALRGERRRGPGLSARSGPRLARSASTC